MAFKVKSGKRAIGFDLKMAWLAISRMYNNLASESSVINTSMGFVLLHIDNEKGTPATKIAPLMGMEPRSLTRILANMEEKKLIYRQPDEHDRRMVRIFPTEFGLQVKAGTKEVVIGFNKELYSNIPEEKLDTFFEVLDTIREITKSKLT